VSGLAQAIAGDVVLICLGGKAVAELIVQRLLVERQERGESAEMEVADII
jgi:hypothetical protein